MTGSYLVVIWLLSLEATCEQVMCVINSWTASLGLSHTHVLRRTNQPLSATNDAQTIDEATRTCWLLLLLDVIKLRR